MSFNEVCKKLGIEKYKERILNSSSTGELFFISDYRIIYDTFKDDEKFLRTFPKFMDYVVERAEETWERPESVFQHIPSLLRQQFSK